MRYLKKFPTLFAGLAVLLVAVILLGGRSALLSAEAKAAEPTTTRTANVNVATVALASNKATAETSETTAVVRDGVQYVTSTISGGRYEPITVQQGIPVQWILNAPNGSLNGCNNRIIIPEYSLQISLETGENAIEFTPDKSGTFAFSCWMGMIRSSITVVDADGAVAANADDGSGQLPAGCCGRR